jgi:hypothetical protein
MNENYQNQNREKILAFIGLLAILALLIYGAYRIVGLISSIPGYSFDPINFGAILILIKLLWDNLKTQNSIISIQNHLLSSYIKSQESTENHKHHVKKYATLSLRQDTTKVAIYQPKRGRPRKVK